MNFLLFLSLFLFILAIYFYSQEKFSIWHTLSFIILTLITISLNLFYQIADYFTGIGINDAVMYHIQVGLTGAGFSEYQGLIIVAGAAIVFVFICLWWAIYTSYHNVVYKKATSYLAVFFILAALFSSPATINLLELYDFFMSSDKVLAENKSDLLFNNFASFYQEPAIQKVGQTKNLVFIYAESLEDTYSDEKVFPDLTPGLNELKNKSIFFSNLQQSFGADFTIAGMVASQCGIPLVSPSHGNSMSGVDRYLPAAICLGDLLKKEGYFLSYYGGADLSFAGKGSFFKDHGFVDVNGVQELLPKIPDKSYRTDWGLYDDSTFELVYNHFLELSQTKDNFALFTLTLDTHHPNGHPSASCKDIIYKDGKNPMLNAVKCSDYLITNFVNKILSSPYADNTVVVVASDHIAMRNTASEILAKQKRQNRLMIISPNLDKPHEVKRLGSTLDTGSTILPFIGYNGLIGLSRNLLDEKQSDKEIELIQKNVYFWQNDINQFWFFPKITGPVQIDITAQEMIVGDRKFKIPVLVELDKNLQTTPRFQFNLIGDWDLVSQASRIDHNSSFLLVDICSEVNRLDSSVDGDGWCLLGSKNKRFSTVTIKDDYILSVDDIKKMTGL